MAEATEPPRGNDATARLAERMRALEQRVAALERALGDAGLDDGASGIPNSDSSSRARRAARIRQMWLSGARKPGDLVG